ncbi:MAG: FKBP-type peptidyl-prolyl cis-trans isomerase [Betaproteobacteria bacterium]|jgi:FKBP-type peptidyl-prolyl cis-trans isomerase SlpA
MTPDIPRIQAHSFLTLHYRLAGPAGDVINTFGGKPATLSLGSGELAPDVESVLIGMAEGEHRTFELPAGAAFGQRNPDMQQWVAASLLRDMGDPQERYAPGDVVQFPTPDGQSSFAGSVLAVNADTTGPDGKPGGAVLFDFNHPLAGQPVSFEVEVIAVL